MSTSNENSTQASSLSWSSTVSTATSGSSLTPVLQARPRMSPPRLVHIIPEPVPYAQLSFNPERNTLVSLLVGKIRAPAYAPLEESPELVGITSSRSSSIDSSTGWSTDSSGSLSDDDGYSNSPQEIFWMNRSWFFDESSERSDTHRALLCGSESSFDESDTSAGCAKKLLRKLKPSCRAISDWAPNRSSQRVDQKRFNLGKHCRYLTLTG